MKKIHLEYTNIPVLYPSIDWFLEKIEKNEYFNFLRVNHGILDQMYLAYDNQYDLLDEHYSEKKYDIISNKMIENSNKDLNKLFLNYHRNSSKTYEVIYIFLQVMREYKNISEKIHISVSLGVGLNTFWGVWDAEHPYQLGRTSVWKVIEKYKSGNFYYSGIFKHYSVTSEIFKLIDLLKSNDFLFIFLGSKHMNLFKNIFNIQNFKHIEIPHHAAINNVDAYVFNIVELYKKHKNVILFHSCGHIMSSYLVNSLYNLNMYTIDIGRSFDILLNQYDHTKHEIPQCWTQLDFYSMRDYINNLRTQSYG